MRALGPGSVSSFLKVILDVVFAALWIGVGVFFVITAAALLLSFNPDLLPSIPFEGKVNGELVQTTAGAQFAKNGSSITSGLLAAGLYLAGILVIVGSLRRIFMTLTAGDPFHPDNVARLRLIGMWSRPGASRPGSPSSWSSCSPRCSARAPACAAKPS